MPPLVSDLSNRMEPYRFTLRGTTAGTGPRHCCTLKYTSIKMNGGERQNKQLDVQHNQTASRPYRHILIDSTSHHIKGTNTILILIKGVYFLSFHLKILISVSVQTHSEQKSQFI